MGGRIDQVESKMSVFAETLNELVDSHNSRSDEIDWIKVKLADLEDRSRQNNLKIRGISESIMQDNLHAYVTEMFQAIFPDVSSQELAIDSPQATSPPTSVRQSTQRRAVKNKFFSNERTLSQTH